MTGGDATGGVPAVPGSGQHRPGTPPPAYPYVALGFGSDRSVTPPPPYSPVAGGDQAVPGLHGVAGKSGVDGSGVDVPGVAGKSGVDRSGVLGGRSLDVLASQTQDSAGERSSAGIRHGSGVSSDAALPETVTPGSGAVADPDSGGAVSPGREFSPGGLTGRDGPFGVDSVAGSGVSHREDAGAGLPGSVGSPADGSQVVPSLQQDRVVASLAGLLVDAVRVLVPAGVVAGGGLVEFVRGGVAGSGGGPVVLVAQGVPGAGVVVSSGQGSALARGVGRDVVALMPGRGGRGPRWTVFAADGSRPRPVGGPAGLVPAGGGQGMAGLADSSAAAAGSGEKTVAAEETPVAQGVSGQVASVVGDAQLGAMTGSGADTMWDTGGIPVRQSSPPDLRREIDRARQGGWSGDDGLVAGWIVRGRHNPRKLVGPLVRDPAEPVAGPSGVGWSRVELRREAVGPVPETIQEERPGRDGTRRRLSWPGGGRADDVASAGGDGRGVVDLPGTGMWVFPVPGVEVDGEGVLRPGGSRWRGQDGGSGLPSVVTGPKRQPRVGPVAGGAGASAGGTRGEAGEGSRGLSGGRWKYPLLGLFPGIRVMAGVRCSRRRIRQHSRTRVRSGNGKRRKITRSSIRRERLLPPVLRS